MSAATGRIRPRTWLVAIACLLLSVPLIKLTGSTSAGLRNAAFVSVAALAVVVVVLLHACGVAPPEEWATESRSTERRSWPVERTHSWMNGYGKVRR